MTDATRTPDVDTHVVERLSTLDRFLPLWIGLAMAGGLVLGRLAPGVNDALQAVSVGGVSLPIALGLLLMMYPVLAKVRYGEIDRVTGDRRMLTASLVLNWVIGPALMFTLAWIFLADLPEYRTGLIIVGLARCIAMVLIWNDLACGDREAAAVLVAINSLFQIVAFSGLAWFYLELLPQWLGLGEGEQLDVSAADIAVSVLVFLGVPLVLGYLTRRVGEARRGRAWYEASFLPRIGPFALYGLLFTIVVLFAFQGETILAEPADVVRIALPLLVYFAVMWTGSFALGWRLRLPYPRTTTLAFTAAGNNFELAIAVSIATFGVASGEALAGTVGPLIEVPALIALVYVSLWAREEVLRMTRPTVLVACRKNAGGARRRPLRCCVITPATASRCCPAGQSRPTRCTRRCARGAGRTRTRTGAAAEALRRGDGAGGGRGRDHGLRGGVPVLPGRTYLDWEVEDPHGQPVERVREIVDDIDARVRGLLVDLEMAT